MPKISQPARPSVRPSDKRSGYLMLISVLIVGAIMIGSVISIVMWGTDQTQSALLNVNSNQARALANACSEEALQAIRDNGSYSGNGNLTLISGTCSYTVVNGGSGNFTIDSIGTSNGAVRKNRIIVNGTMPLINIVSWQEVAD